MSKISRQENKARYKTGMYPTQQDFENVFDSYVHKDDIVPAEQVKSGDKTIIQLINELSERTHTHQIADVEGLQTFIDQVNNFLGTVDASDETINRWKELEAFLQGITDTENLLTLLQQYRQEILSAVEGQYLMQVPDLDAYTTAPDGKIVQYIGATTDKYKHGFIYERNGAGEVTIPKGTYLLRSFVVTSVDESFDRDAIEQYIQSPESYVYAEQVTVKGDSGIYLIDDPEPHVGDRVLVSDWSTGPSFNTITQIKDGKLYFSEELPHGIISAKISSFVDKYFARWNCGSKTILVLDNEGPDFYRFGDKPRDTSVLFVPELNALAQGTYDREKLAEPITVGTPASWQPLKVQNVID